MHTHNEQDGSQRAEAAENRAADRRGKTDASSNPATVDLQKKQASGIVSWGSSMRNIQAGLTNFWASAIFSSRRAISFFTAVLSTPALATEKACSMVFGNQGHRDAAGPRRRHRSLPIFASSRFPAATAKKNVVSIQVRGVF